MPKKPPQRNPSDIFTEDVIRLQDVPRFVNESSKAFFKAPHIGTVWRWHKKGVLSSDGRKRVHLETVKVGGSRILTSKQAVTRFLNAVSSK